MPLPLSVLDLAPVSAGHSGPDALRNTLDLAQLADHLGYTRFWLAEHHNIASVASSSPEIIIGHVASVTSRIRVGSGGIMLPNQAPLKVVESFRLLEAFHPGRVDLGIGRAPGTDQLTALALRRTQEAFAPDFFPKQLAEIIGFSSGRFPDGHPFRAIQAMPTDVPLPPIWLLGSTSGYSAQTAGTLGMGFAFAHHINPNTAEAVAALQAYRAAFQPSEQFPQPHAILAISVLCADTDEEADFLASSFDLMFLQLSQGNPGPIPSPETALAHPFTPTERAHIRAHRNRVFIGSPKTIQPQIEALATQTGADELMIMTTVYSHDARRHSYQLLADAFNLAPTP